MVRYKKRYIICKIETPGVQIKNTFNDKAIYHAIRNELKLMHGDFAVASLAKSPSLQVQSLNKDTNIILIQTQRDSHRLVQSSLVFVKKIGNEDAFLNTLHLGGTIRSCYKFLIRYHRMQLPKLLTECKTEDERIKLKAMIASSCKGSSQHLSLLERNERKPEIDGKT